MTHPTAENCTTFLNNLDKTIKKNKNEKLHVKLLAKREMCQISVFSFQDEINMSLYFTA
jgi:hypothetical protein